MLYVAAGALAAAGLLASAPAGGGVGRSDPIVGSAPPHYLDGSDDWTASAAAPRRALDHCQYVDNTDYVGHVDDRVVTRVGSKLDCCMNCVADPACAVAVWAGENSYSSCILKTADSLSRQVFANHSMSCRPRYVVADELSVPATVPGDLVTDLQRERSAPTTHPTNTHNRGHPDPQRFCPQVPA